jgi:hypothetical protein
MHRGTRRIERWQVDEVEKFLERVFAGSRIENYPRGGHVAHLFVVTEALLGEKRPPPHQLLVTGHFFARFKDSIALQQALIGGDVAQQLARAGDRTVELY